MFLQVRYDGGLTRAKGHGAGHQMPASISASASAEGQSGQAR
jgi:hypothetical protein